MRNEADIYTAPSPLVVQYVALLSILLIIVVTIFALDTRLTTESYITAEVVDKKLEAPSTPGDYPHIIIVKAEGDYYQARVSRPYYKGISIDSIVLLIKEKKLISDLFKRYVLFDGKIPLQQTGYTPIKQIPIGSEYESSVPTTQDDTPKNNRPVLNSRAVLNPQIHE